jgi:hypothetical protein
VASTIIAVTVTAPPLPPLDSALASVSGELAVIVSDDEPVST